jgi:hypothetical protein
MFKIQWSKILAFRGVSNVNMYSLLFKKKNSNSVFFSIA